MTDMAVASSQTDDRLGALLEEYETWLRVERGLAPNSLAAYRRDLRRYVDYLRRHGQTTLGSVDETTVAGFVDELRDARRDDGRPKYAASSIARAVAAVHSFHRFCLEEGVVVRDPSEDVGAPRVPQGIPKALTEPEVDALLAAVAGDGPRALRDRAILETLYAGGVRISELVGLDLDDLDLESSTVRLSGKGGKQRVVPLGSYAQDAVSAYLVRARPDLVAAGRGTPAVFLNARGGRLSRQSAWTVLVKAADRAGVTRDVSPHTLRHSFATHLLDGGADVRVVQELLGHASVTTTQVYTLVTVDNLREVFATAHPRARG